MSARCTRLVRRLLGCAAAVVCHAAPLGAQMPKTTVAPELRADVLGNHRTSVQVGGGLEIPAGAYTRVGVIAAVGPVMGGASGGEGRVDVLARFLLDPFRQTRWGLSAGGGVSMRATSHGPLRPNLLVALDLEGPRSSHGISPAFQVGLGGGVRAGFGLRWSGRATR